MIDISPRNLEKVVYFATHIVTDKGTSGLEKCQILNEKEYPEADEKYVAVDDCNGKQKTVNDKFANDDTRIKLFEQKMKSWEWMFKLIATGTVGTLITSILSLILK